MAKYRFRFVDLGARDGYFIQSVYEAIAYFVGQGSSPPTLVFVYPLRPYVCIGVNQLPDLEVNMEYCRVKGIEVVRRQVGGGAVYLDSNQQFYHVVMPRGHSLAQGTIRDIFERVLQAIVCFYRSYGLSAQYKPVNDVVIGGRKASGNGAALLHDAVVVIGNVILDFDAETAASVLRVPDEKLRSHLVSSMKEWVTSLKGELGSVPPREDVTARLRKCFEETLSLELEEGSLTSEEYKLALEISSRMKSREWLYALSEEREYLLQRYAPSSRVVKIKEGHYVVYTEHRGHKTYKGLIEVVDGVVKSCVVSSESFTITPREVVRVARCLEGLRVRELSSKSVECLELVSSVEDREDLKGLIAKIQASTPT